jgi:hypothetical protein
VAFGFEEVFEGECVARVICCGGFLGRALFFCFENETGRKRVFVFAGVAAIWTCLRELVLYPHDAIFGLEMSSRDELSS